MLSSEVLKQGLRPPSGANILFDDLCALEAPLGLRSADTSHGLVEKFFWNHLRSTAAVEPSVLPEAFIIMSRLGRERAV